MKSNNNQEILEPLFNSGLAYLERIHKLLMAIHSENSNQDYTRMFLELCTLQTEMIPRMNKEMINENNKHFSDCSQYFNQSQNSSSYRRSHFNVGYFASKLYSWLTFLQVTAHRLKLVMPDAPNESEATIGLKN